MSLWLDRALVFGAYLALCMTEAEFVRIMKHLRAPAPYPPFLGRQARATTHTFDSPRGLACIVCLPEVRSRKPIDSHALLVHEAAHVWQHTRRYIGETSPSDEFEAYALQNISWTLMRAYEERRKRKRGR